MGILCRKVKLNHVLGFIGRIIRDVWLMIMFSIDFL